VGELLSLKIEAGTAGATVRLSGEIDMATAPDLRECLATLTGDVVVDLTEVTFVDSRAIALLIAEHKRRVGAGERFVVTGSSPMALRTFEITGVDKLLNLNGDSSESGREEPART
jgi:anti-anti-sigma factor